MKSSTRLNTPCDKPCRMCWIWSNLQLLPSNLFPTFYQQSLVQPYPPLPPTLAIANAWCIFPQWTDNACVVDVFSTTTPPPSSGWSWTDYVFWMTIHGFDTLAGTLKDVCSTHGCVHSPTSIDPSCKSKKWECRKSGERGSHQRRNMYVCMYVCM